MVVLTKAQLQYYNKWISYALDEVSRLRSELVNLDFNLNANSEVNVKRLSENYFIIETQLLQVTQSITQITNKLQVCRCGVESNC